MAEEGGEQSTYKVSEDVPQRYYEIEHARMTLDAGLARKNLRLSDRRPH